MSSQTTNLLLELRATGLSQSEIQRLTSIPQPRLSRWEAGGAPAGADDALKLQALLDQVRIDGIARVKSTPAVDAAAVTGNETPD